MKNEKVRLDRIATVPNFISLLRLACLPFIILFLIRQNDILALAFIVGAGLSDAVDGLLARLLRQESNLGRILDPVVDKVSVATTVILLALNYGLPVWLATVIIVRDALILVGSLLVINLRAEIGVSNFWGKAAGVCFFLLMIGYVLRLHPIHKYLIGAAAGFVALSLAFYVVEFYRWLRT